MRTTLQNRRVVALMIVFAAAFGSVGVASAAWAGRGAQVTAPSSSAPSSSVAISPGFAFTGADVFSAGSPKVARHLDAYKTAVFVQSFFGAAVATKVQHQRPPAGARAYRVDVTGTWNGGNDLSTRSIFYATDGTHAWIAPAPASTPLAKVDFWVAPDRVVSAFEGRATLVPTAGTNAVAPTTTTLAPPSHSSSDGVSGWWWLAAGLAVVVVVGVVLGRLRTRARANAQK
jgi:hypothetical protein